MTITDIESASARRERLHDQLVCLQFQHEQLIADARLAQSQWATAVVNGEGTALLADRSRHCRVAADDCAAAIAVVSGQLAEVDRQLAELHTHADLDAQLRAHATAVETFTDRLTALTQCHEVAVDGLSQLATELHELHHQVHTALCEGQALNAQAAAIRAHAAKLQRSEQVHDAPDSTASTDRLSAPACSKLSSNRTAASTEIDLACFGRTLPW
jgi:chromosome segregation ATPase